MRPKIYLFGDSITEASFHDGGWGASLANHFSRSADVVLRGYSGYNTRWALKVLNMVFSPENGGGGGVPPSPPLAVTVFFGANDACLADRSSAFQHVPVDEYKENLRSIVTFIKKQWPKTIVLLITPPPIDEAARLQYPFSENEGLPERTNEAAGDYAKACLAIAAECEIPAIDLWTKMQQFPDWKKNLLIDGLHLTHSGNAVVFEELIKALGKEGVSLETIPVDLPLLAEVDPSDPLKAFENLK